MKIKTTEDFVKKLEEKFGDKYDYSKITYLNRKTPVEIVCPKHGSWFPVISNLFKPTYKGCPTCNKRKCNIEIFKYEAEIVHGNYYNYDKVLCERFGDRVIITCPVHGDFEQLVDVHLKGHGCFCCASVFKASGRKLNTKDFIVKAKEKHGSAYDYSKVNYINNYTKVEIICPEHGSFFQIPNNHLRGATCKKCVTPKGFGFRKEQWITQCKGRKGIFYIIKCWNNTETFYKVGITSKSIKVRYASKRNMPYNWRIIRECISFDLSYIWDLEKRFLKFVKKYKYNPKIYFPGSVKECYQPILKSINYFSVDKL